MSEKVKEGKKMKQKTYNRFDIDGKTWKKIAPHLKGQLGQHDGIAKDNRNFINTVVWILRTGEPWRNLPTDCRKWGTVCLIFIRWQRKGIWKKLFEILKGNKKFEWLMIDSTYIKDHQHLCGDRRENQGISRTKGGLIRKYT